MDTNVNENEVSTVESSAPQTNVENTEVTSVSSTNNYTQDKSNNQEVKSNAMKNIKKPIFVNLDGKVLTNILGDYLLQQEFVTNLNGVLHTFYNGICNYNDSFIRAYIYKLVPTIKPAVVKEVMDYISAISSVDTIEESPFNFVAFNNGVFDIETSKFCEFNPHSFYLTSKLNIDYIASATTNADVEGTNDFFRKLSNRQ